MTKHHHGALSPASHTPPDLEALLVATVRLTHEYPLAEPERVGALAWSLSDLAARRAGGCDIASEMVAIGRLLRSSTLRGRPGPRDAFPSLVAPPEVSGLRLMAPHAEKAPREVATFYGAPRSR